MTSNPVKEEAVTDEQLIAFGGVADDVGVEWATYGQLETLFLFAMRQADPRIAELEAALEEVRTNVRDMQRIMLNSWSHESSSAKQAIETIDAVLNRKDKP